MKHFAHIFIGNEFSDLVSSLGKTIIKYGEPGVSSYLNLFLLDNSKEKSVSTNRLLSSLIVKDNELFRGDKNIEISWGEENTCEISDQKIFSDFFSKRIFDRVLNINTSGKDSVLHVILHFPIYKQEALETIKLLYNAIENSGKPVNLDFMGYGDDISEILEPKYKITSPSNRQFSDFIKFKEERKMAYERHFVAIQNASPNGISLGLNLQSLSDVIAQFSLILIDYYDEIFPNTLEYKDVVSFGLSSLYLDKYLFVEYLLGKTILHSMDNSGVNKNDVDVNFACDTANRLLEDKVSLLSEFFKQIDEKNDYNNQDNFTKIQNQFEDDISQIIEKYREIFQTNKLITNRAAILAAILSKTECELFTHSIFNYDTVSIDNLFIESIDYFVENDKVDFYRIDNEPIINPIKELKVINTKLINSESEIRELDKQLSTYEKELSDAHKVEDCYIEDGFYHFQNQKFRLLPTLTEEPLEETYKAHETTIPSVDLRQNFNSVKNQGEQGSCLAFSVTSIFEYALKLNQSKESDLSEAFLYYNSRKMDTIGDVSVTNDIGSRFKPSMDSLHKYGIALEKFCPYSEDRFDQKPSDEAYRDALSRRLIKALNVNKKVYDIKSALADGYPVAASFILYPSFSETNNGFIPMPDEKEIAEEFSEDVPKDKYFRHAMVITGFSDQLKMFVVRNSWGTDWGEDGYGYLPYSYVENERLCDFTCIITEVESLSIDKMEHIPALKIDDTDLNIKYILTKRSLEEETEKAGNNRKQRDSLRIYLEQIKRTLSSPNERDIFIAKSKEHFREEQEEFKKAIRLKQEEQEVELFKFNKYKKSIIIKSALYLLGFIILFVLFGLIDKYMVDFIHKNEFYFWLLPVFAIIIGCVFYLSNKHWKQWRDKRDELEDDIRKLNKEITAKEKEINDFKIKTFSAWTLLRSMEKAQTHFQFQYSNIISLINNLRTWYKEIVDWKEKLSLETNLPNTSLLQKDILDAYFNNKLRQNEIFDIDLCEDIDNHKIEKDYLKEFKERLFDKIAKHLFSVLTLLNFDISAHIVDDRFSEIAKSITRDLVYKMDDKSDLFLNISSSERGEIIRSTGIYASSLNLYRDNMRKKLGKYSEPYFETNDKYRLVFVKTATLWFKECVMLKPKKEIQ